MVAPATTSDPRALAVWAALDEIADPEIPAISLVELGVIGEGLRVARRGRGAADGRPAADLRGLSGHRHHAAADRGAAARHGAGGRGGGAPPLHAAVDVGPDHAGGPREAAGERLRAAGPHRSILRRRRAAGAAGVATCPYCGSRNTTLDNPFGPTLCRAIYHCDECNQPFEQFKAI